MTEEDRAEIKLFGKWDFSKITCEDVSLKNYIACSKANACYIPHSGICWSAKSFKKAKCPIVERLANGLMMHGRNAGKKLLAVRVIKQCLEIIHLTTDKNPMQVLVDAVSKAGPREDNTRIGRGGVVRVQSVDVSPLRRVNLGVYFICMGARKNAFRSAKSLSETLAEEIMATAEGKTQQSFSLQKRDTLERVAKLNR